MEILKYNSEHESDVLSTISADSDWSLYANEKDIALYKEALKNGITYVCYNNNTFCGYIRAIPDSGLSIYISELYVLSEWRNKKIGQSLIERMKDDFKNMAVYINSDEDAYYIKKGYKKVGSIFEI
ncbi:GNAT family N-acetyltransferase [Candidatus Latescibacterota bacterium]